MSSHTAGADGLGGTDSGDLPEGAMDGSGGKTAGTLKEGICGRTGKRDVKYPMTSEQIDFARACIREGRVHDFYVWSAWRAKRLQILRQDHYEGQECKKQGRYRRAVLVHHVQHLQQHPELALCDTFTGIDGQEHRQLISVCKECHETVCHPERMRKQPRKKKFWTEERWD